MKALYKHNTRIRRLNFRSVCRQTYCLHSPTHTDPFISIIIFYYCSFIPGSWEHNVKMFLKNSWGAISYLFNNGRALTRCLPRPHTQSARTGVTSLHLSVYVSRQNKWSTVTFLTRHWDTRLSLCLSLF